MISQNYIINGPVMSLIDPEASGKCQYIPSKEDIDGLKFVDRVVGFHQVDSTNSLAIRLAERTAIAPGTLLIADEQTKGKGRSVHTWHSPGGVGIYASLLMKGFLPPENSPFVTLAAGVAIHDSLSHFIGEDKAKKLDIKWPNDILWEGRKLCGILVESSVKGEITKYMVLGFGINVSNKKFPDDISPRAISLFQICGRFFDMKAVLKQTLKRLDELLRELEEGEFEQVLKSWEKCSTFAFGRKVKFFRKGKPIMGTTSGLDPSGGLRIKTVTGSVQVVYGGEIFEF